MAKWRQEHGSEFAPTIAGAAKGRTTPTPAGTVANPAVAVNVVPETKGWTYFGVALLVVLGAYIYVRGAPPTVHQV